MPPILLLYLPQQPAYFDFLGTPVWDWLGQGEEAWQGHGKGACPFPCMPYACPCQFSAQSMTLPAHAL